MTQRMACAMVAVMLGAGLVPTAEADDDSDRMVSGVLSGLLGVPQADAYSAKERDRLIAFLQSGQYVTSRQGEPVDLMVYGVPLTRADHVYTARPVQPAGDAASP